MTPGRASEPYRAAVRKGPDCIHGQLGGDIVRPWTGTPACPLCRRRRPIHWRTIGEPAPPAPLPANVIKFKPPGRLFQVPAAERLPRWSGRAAARLTRAVLARDYDAELGYTPCHWCGGRATTFDHWPVGRDEGGPDTLDNGVPSCLPCNQQRGGAYTARKRAETPKPSRRW